MVNVTKEQIIELSKNAQEIKDLDWGMIPVEEGLVFSQLADAVLGAYSKVTPEYKDLVMITAILSLTVQTFVLNQQRLELINTITSLQNNLKGRP